MVAYRCDKCGAQLGARWSRRIRIEVVIDFVQGVCSRLGLLRRGEARSLDNVGADGRVVVNPAGLGLSQKVELATREVITQEERKFRTTEDYGEKAQFFRLPNVSQKAFPNNDISSCRSRHVPGVHMNRLPKCQGG